MKSVYPLTSPAEHLIAVSPSLVFYTSRNDLFVYNTKKGSLKNVFSLQEDYDSFCCLQLTILGTKKFLILETKMGEVIFCVFKNKTKKGLTEFEERLRFMMEEKSGFSKGMFSKIGNNEGYYFQGYLDSSGMYRINKIKFIEESEILEYSHFEVSVEGWEKEFHVDWIGASIQELPDGELEVFVFSRLLDYVKIFKIKEQKEEKKNIRTEKIKKKIGGFNLDNESSEEDQSEAELHNPFGAILEKVKTKSPEFDPKTSPILELNIQSFHHPDSVRHFILVLRNTEEQAILLEGEDLSNMCQAQIIPECSKINNLVIATKSGSVVMIKHPNYQKNETKIFECSVIALTIFKSKIKTIIFAASSENSLAKLLI